jgi:RNA polymerase sigma-70 factor (ECF subfamily)
LTLCAVVILKGWSLCLIRRLSSKSMQSLRVQGPPREIRGAENWARGAIAFSRQLTGTVQPMLVNGEVGLVWTPGGRIFRVLRCSFVDGKIARADVITDPARLRELDLAVLDE